MVCAWATCIFFWNSRTISPWGSRSICGHVVQAGDHQYIFFLFPSFIFSAFLLFASLHIPLLFIAPYLD